MLTCQLGSDWPLTVTFWCPTCMFRLNARSRSCWWHRKCQQNHSDQFFLFFEYWKPFAQKFCRWFYREMTLKQIKLNVGATWCEHLWDFSRTLIGFNWWQLAGKTSHRKSTRYLGSMMYEFQIHLGNRCADCFHIWSKTTYIMFTTFFHEMVLRLKLCPSSRILTLKHLKTKACWTGVFMIVSNWRLCCVVSMCLDLDYRKKQGMAAWSMFCFSNCVKVVSRIAWEKSPFGATMILLGWGFTYPKSNHYPMKSYGAMKRNRILHFLKRLGFFSFSTPILPCNPEPRGALGIAAFSLASTGPAVRQRSDPGHGAHATQRGACRLPWDVGRWCMDQRHNI